MSQKPSQEPTQSRMLQWVNTLLPNSISPISSYQQLVDGTVFRILLTQLDPQFDSAAEAYEYQQTDGQLHQNFKLLSLSLQNMQPGFALDIGKLAEGQIAQISRILLFLYHKFEEDTPVKMLESTQQAMDNPEDEIKVESLLNYDLQKLEEQKYQITDEEIDQLLTLREKLKKIEDIANSADKTSSKIDSITVVCTNRQIQSKKFVKSKPLPYHFSQQDIRYILQSRLQNKKRKLKSALEGTYFIKKSILKQMAEQRHSNVFVQVGRLTEEILQHLSKHVQFTDVQLKIISNFSQVIGNIQEFDYLFFGRRLTPHMFRTHWIDQNDSAFVQQRKDIKHYCLIYYQSHIFVKRILYSQRMIMKNKLFILQKLDMIERFPQIPITETGLFTIRESSIRIKHQRTKKSLRDFNDIFSEKEKKVQNQQSRHSKQLQETNIRSHRSKENIASQDTQRLIQVERKPFGDFWSVHRRVLIATEVNYIYNKKPDFEDKETYDAFVNSEAHQRFEFDGGFLFPGKRSKIAIDFLKIIAETGKYPHLMTLFAEPLDVHAQRLRDFVRMMLQLKHHSIVKEFIQIYDLIVGEIMQIPFQSIRKPIDRATVVDKVANMVEKGMKRINEYFVNTYDMSEDPQSTYKLMRVTVYCFLAEFHSLNHNEFFRKTFSLPAIDKKESSNIFHFEKVVNYQHNSQL